MSDKIKAYLLHKIQQRKEKNAFRQFTIAENTVDFCSNDYLGFAKDSNLHKETLAYFEEHTGNVNGSTGARTITGTSHEIVQLESYLASYHQAEAALFYNSGYTANLGLFAALPYRGDTILYDELIHASIRDGMQLSKASSYSFAHNDVAALEKRLEKASGNIFVVVEAIYSMDGDAAPLQELAQICEKYQAAFIVDEAHSNGIFGKKGSGLVCALGLEKQVFARVMTFGKALGCHGAVVVGSQDLKDFLINYSRPFIYTTAPAPHQVFSVKTAYDNLSKVNDKVLYLSNLIKLFKSKLHGNLQAALIESFSPIQCLIIPGNNEVKRVCNAVQEAGFDVRPIVAPTVPEGKERIRICLHAFNTEAQVLALVDSLHENCLPNEK
jgi:8-amino-7-oxononanoate synthase